VGQETHRANPEVALSYQDERLATAPGAA
jgi:hypothetical protein